jgi:hypothetical protein
MVIKKNSIVRRISTSEVYEVVEIVGKLLLCDPINLPSQKGIKTPLTEDEVEVIMDEETDTFNLLFRSGTDGEGS